MLEERGSRRSAIRKLLVKAFDEALRAQFPGFSKVKLPVPLRSDGPVWGWNVTPGFSVYTRLEFKKYSDDFTVDLGWSKKEQWPAFVDQGSPRFLKADDDEFRGRLPFLWGVEPKYADRWWELFPSLMREQKRGLDADRMAGGVSEFEEPSVEESSERIQPLVDDAIAKFAEYAIPFFRSCAANRGIDWPLDQQVSSTPTLHVGLPKAAKRYTPEEYYELEHDAEYKSEYYQGEMFAMAFGSRRHSLIVINISSGLHQRFRVGPCIAYDPNLRVKVKPTGLRTYPDVSVFCRPLERDPEDKRGQTFTNPTAVFEVFSKTTEKFDRHGKWENYCQIESLKYYILVAQKEPRVEVLEQRPDGSWIHRASSGLQAVLQLPAIGVELPLAEIYDRVDFSKTEDED
jgi:Uma2 family endonuclease